MTVLLSHLRLPAGVFAVLLLTAIAAAQHDPHRNAMRHVARGQWDQANRELEKAEGGDPETLYIQTLIALGTGDVEAAVRNARGALDAGMPMERFVVGPRDALQPLYKADEYKQWSAQHNPSPIVHGPMLRHMHNGAEVWVRTADASSVQVNVYGSNALVASSQVITTSRDADFTGSMRVEGLTPATAYKYEVLVDGARVALENTTLTTYPAQGQPAVFSVGFGGGAGFNPEWETMWDTILLSQPAAFLMLGDNVYIDDPEHVLTNHYCYYRRQSRPEWRRFTASTSIYAVYDDHDFGLNDCIPGPAIESPAWKRSVWNVFRQNWVNPYYGGGESQPGCWCDFYIGNVHFILLDGRYYRTRDGQPSMLGPAQKAWLWKKLKGSRGTFKVVASPVAFTEGVKPRSLDTWDGFADEREEIFAFLKDNRIDGVILVAADRHRSDLRVTTRPNGYDLYEFESSRLTNRHVHKIVETPGLVWGYNDKCSFGLIRFDTTRPDPLARFEVITIDGESAHSFDLPLSQLVHR